MTKNLCMAYRKLCLKPNRRHSLLRKLWRLDGGSSEVFSGNQSFNLLNFEMAIQRVIVMTVDYFGTNNLGDVQKGLMIKYTLYIFPALR